ncbi:LpxI family protein [Pontivivens ytuae]|uniref:UDP-2,3-diacylglucosamine diphosphatase LpxI n=1 Tax=Pontivivens ytuae TaxID=2789856 RepID=A0A7S9LSQ3_9RHOB|nr:UDP-2,3-diacylglucosamine diphosphatase LpxI [Pontivivens ytuae]QPH53985.1 UDP-2,3-diacylglucosamine diphosphatase LpxI [Pontivivens ytuae]
MSGPDGPLGILAGRGDLPKRIAEARAAEGRPYLVVALEGFAGGWADAHPHVTAPITGVRRILDALRGAGCAHLVMAGGVERPSINPLALDRKALSWLPRLAPALRKGDDALLRTVRGLLEHEGLTLIGADEVLEDLRVATGVLGTHQPNREDQEDAARAEAILAALAPLDVGQGAVVAFGQVRGIETIQGTDALLDFVARTHDGDRAGVFVKRSKPGQDRKLDMPTIGVETVRRAASAGLRGIVIEADAVLILDRDAVIAEADAAGLFLWARP